MAGNSTRAGIEYLDSPPLELDLYTDFSIAPVDFEDERGCGYQLARQELVWRVNQAGSYKPLVEALRAGKKVKEVLAEIGVSSVEVLRDTVLNHTGLVTRGTKLVGTVNNSSNLNIQSVGEFYELQVETGHHKIFHGENKNSHSFSSGGFALAFNTEQDT